MHELYPNFDDNVEQVVVYLDFCKAFDPVDQHYLLVILTDFVFDENVVVLISSYLDGRKQSDKVATFMYCLPVSRSLLCRKELFWELFFFLLYIDEMYEVSEFSKWLSFADHATIMSSGIFHTICSK